MEKESRQSGTIVVDVAAEISERRPTVTKGETMETKCIRIDQGDGSETECELSRAEEKIRDAYKPAEPVLEEFRKGTPIRTMFATYELRQCN
jgi:hypothetical protein